MTKNKRKVIALMMAMVMVMASMFAMTTSVFAGTTENEQVKVSIYLQDVYRGDESFEPIQSVWQEEPITVTVDSGTTLRAAIEKAVAMDNNLNAVHWETDYNLYLDSVTYMDWAYENEDSYDFDATTGENIYLGNSWMYFYGTPSQMPASTYDYPQNENLTEKTVTADTTVTLSYEYLEYRWK